ncbi:hypothetical protein KW801_01710 [Candidatus Saccharibacteria bacterium]|nr:hypothetical protein [Candidatus Saccharibacteria bacterium]
MTNLETLKKMATEYNDRLDTFWAEAKLPEVWLDDGYDHFALKAYSREDYEDIIEQFKPVTEFIAEVDLDDRQIATAKLLGHFALNMTLSFSDWMSIDHIEIMLAREDEQGDKPVRFDHSELFKSHGLIPVMKVLEAKGLRPFNPPEFNRSHMWVSIVFGEENDEVKFTDKRLSEIIQDDIRTGRAKIL